MAKGTNVKEEMSEEEIDAFIKTVKNGGAVGGFSTRSFSIEQFTVLEKLQKEGRVTIELHPVYFVTVKGTEVVKSM